MTARLWLLTGSVASLAALSACEIKDQTASDAGGANTATANPQAGGSPAVPTIPAAAPKGAALAQADSQNGDFRMEVTEASRSNGVLTIKARVTLLGGATGTRRLLYGHEAPDLYVVAGDQKYMILKDNEGEALTTDGGYNPSFRQLGGTNNWWGKYPAPPPEVKSVDFYFKDFLPLENIPITDR